MEMIGFCIKVSDVCMYVLMFIVVYSVNEDMVVVDFVVFSFPFTGREFLWAICFYSQDG